MDECVEIFPGHLTDPVVSRPMTELLLEQVSRTRNSGAIVKMGSTLLVYVMQKFADTSERIGIKCDFEACRIRLVQVP